jgi:hypothetical protein
VGTAFVTVRASVALAELMYVDPADTKLAVTGIATERTSKSHSFTGVVPATLRFAQFQTRPLVFPNGPLIEPATV